MAGAPPVPPFWRSRAQGRPLWGVLRGDVDHFVVRLRRVQTIEEHVQVSVLYKQFFAGELEVLCSMPEFWRKVTILYSGGDDFRDLRILGCPDSAGTRVAAIVSPLHRGKPQGFSRSRSQDHHDGASACARIGHTDRRSLRTGGPRISISPNRRTRIAFTCWGACSNGNAWRPLRS